MNDGKVKVKPILEELEYGGQAAIMDESKEINLETKEDPRPTLINVFFLEDKVEELKVLHYELRDCFAWTYVEMPNISLVMTIHKFNHQAKCTIIQASR